MPETDEPKTTPLKAPIKTDKNIEATKYYTFNETGNIMISSTTDTSEPISEAVQKVFAEVSVFFAGMTRAITTSINPNTGKPYSLYNYNALSKIIDSSGLFVRVTEEDVKYTTDSVGADFSKSLIESLLGLATGAGEMAFASAMVSSLGDEGARISASSSDTESKVANIVFVCEHLLGMPMVSAIVVYADCKKHQQQIQLGPCFSETRIETSWVMHKDTYFFVTPTFIKDYAADLDTVEANPNYVQLIHWLQGLLEDDPTIYGVFDGQTSNSVVEGGSALVVGRRYTLMGRFLGREKGHLQYGDKKDTLEVTESDWSETEISFTCSEPSDTLSTIDVYDKDGKLLVSSPGSFTFKQKEPNDPKKTTETEGQAVS